MWSRASVCRLALLLVVLQTIAADGVLAQEEQFLLKWGSYGVDDGHFKWPYAVAVDRSGFIYVSEEDSCRIQKFDYNGNFLLKWGSQGSNDGQFFRPKNLAIDSQGYVFVVDIYNHRIQKFDGNGNFLSKWGSYGKGDGQFDHPVGIAIDSNNYVYVSEVYSHRIQKFDSNGNLLSKWGTKGSENGQFLYPNEIAVDSSGTVYVADTWNYRIQKFDSNGNFLSKWGSYGSGDGQFLNVFGIAIDSSGLVYAADTGNNRIQKFDSNGRFISKWGSYGSGDGQFIYPYSVTVDSYGRIYVPDHDNHRIQVFSTPNRTPVADSGSDQSVHIGTLVMLDGSASSDPEGNYPLTYAWQIISTPLGSTAELSNINIPSPIFKVDLPGEYRIQLKVTDSLGASSTPDEVIISTFNTAPVADAGDDQSVFEIGTLVQLGTQPGRQSYDQDGDAITYLWSITTKPDGSAAMLSNWDSSKPSFVADEHGDYGISLEVSDGWDLSSDTVWVKFSNVKPIANAGGNQSVLVGDTVCLNGIESIDANLDPLTYVWGFVSKPAGSLAELSDSMSPLPKFVTDQAGTYILSLVVKDGFENSDPSNVTVTAITIQDETVQTLQEQIETINQFDPSVLKNSNLANALTNKINAALEKIDQALYQEALDQLQNDILKKTDGCALTGVPDKNDWITSCEDQMLVHPNIIRVIEMLQRLI